MEASSHELKSDLSFDDQEQREHAAEQLILQTVKHHEANAGIQSHNIAKETRIDKDLVDKALKELIRRREVMISRSGMNVFFLPFKMPAPRITGRPTNVPATKVVQKSSEESTPEPTKKAAELTGKCPICGSVQTSHQERRNLVAQMRVHLLRMHKVGKEEGTKMLIDAGIIKKAEKKAVSSSSGRSHHKKTTSSKAPTDTPVHTWTADHVPSDPSLTFREEVAMGILADPPKEDIPPMPADRHNDTGEDPSAEISEQDLQQVIPQGMNEDRPTPTWGMGIHDVLELVKQIATEAGIRMTYVYGCSETDACKRERLSIDLEG